MTWAQLLLLLQSMAKAEHSAMDDPVRVITNDERYNVELFENLVEGSLILIPHFSSPEEDDGSEA